MHGLGRTDECADARCKSMAVPVPRHVRSVAIYVHPLHHSGGLLCPTIALHMNKSRAHFAYQGF